MIFFDIRVDNLAIIKNLQKITQNNLHISNIMRNFAPDYETPLEAQLLFDITDIIVL